MSRSTTATDADFILITYDGTPGPGASSLLGRMSPPGRGATRASPSSTPATSAGPRRASQPGGFSFITLIHEFGHGHGLAHPHDNGGHSGIMHGVVHRRRRPSTDYTNGDYDLNQGVYTMMSYEDGWQTSPYGQPATHGSAMAGSAA